MNNLKKLIHDTKKYSIIDILTQPSWLGVANYRLAGFLWNLKSVKFLYYLYFPIWRIISIITGIEIYGKTKIGEGLKIIHFGQIFINPRSVIGKNCLIYNGVSIGISKFDSLGCPTLGDNIKIGTGAKILGEINIGDNCKIGANTVVCSTLVNDSVISVFKR